MAVGSDNNRLLIYRRLAMLELTLGKRYLRLYGERIEISKELAKWIKEFTNIQIVFVKK